MKVLQCSLFDVVEKLNVKYFLPSIQRSFVWDENQIIALFESLYRDYPIGNSIVWKIKEWNNQLPLFEFESSPKERVEEIAAQKRGLTYKAKYYAVLDGQQRLTSLLIGFRGCFKAKKAGKGLKNSDSNFIEKHLYFDLYSTKETDLFAFMADDSVGKDRKSHFWYRLENIYSAAGWDNFSVCLNNLKKNIGKNWTRKSATVKALLKRLFKMLYDEEVFSYYEIDYSLGDLETVCDIFTRVNTGGTILKKADLLFSNLMLVWSEEGKNEIKEAMGWLRSGISDLSQDFIMRSCLYLSDLPVKYNLKSFNRTNINKIINNWPSIKDAVWRLVECLGSIGFVDGVKGLSENALIPILYYIKLKGRNLSSKELNQIKRYYISSQIFGTFGGNSDSVLSNMRDEINRQYKKNKTFDYEELKSRKSYVAKFFNKNSVDIEDIVENTIYGTARAYYVLRLMYPMEEIGRKDKKYHVDHIHPRALFNQKTLAELGVEDRLEDWKEMCNQLPNLQLLDEQYNKEKSKTPIAEYVESMGKSKAEKFRKANLLPENLDLEDFDDFCKTRKEKIIDKLMKLLKIKG